MRNTALHDQLRALAERAAERLNTTLEAGAEIPFEVAESPGATSVLYRYRPLSGEFLREHFGELRGIEGFGPVLLAVAKLEGASAYLRVLGQSYLPASDRDRAEVVVREFLVRLWEEVSTFELDEARFERAYRELEAVVYDNTVVTTVLAPLLGVRLPAERWDLGSGTALVRGDLCEAPPEAVWLGGRDGAQANTLVVFSVESAPNDPPPLSAARLAFRKLLTTLRLFKSGAVTLGHTGWWRLDDGPWQSLSLGFAGRSRRACDYELEPAERDELAELFELVRQRPLEGGSLPWALARFELGCEQMIPVEGLTDHLLALRALLDGEHETPAGISSRLAALCAEPPGRAELRARVEQAFELERLVMHGRIDSDQMKLSGCHAPVEIARELEEHLRAILKDMVCGYLDPEVKRFADELLRAETEARPNVDQQPSPGDRKTTPAQERRKPKVPMLESWDEVPVSVPDETADPPEPEFVLRRTKPGERKKPTARRRGQRPAAHEEQATEETAAVGGVRGLSPDEDPLDWGFDDDPADYSAAV